MERGPGASAVVLDGVLHLFRLLREYHRAGDAWSRSRRRRRFGCELGRGWCRRWRRSRAAVQRQSDCAANRHGNQSIAQVFGIDGRIHHCTSGWLLGRVASQRPSGRDAMPMIKIKLSVLVAQTGSVTELSRRMDANVAAPPEATARELAEATAALGMRPDEAEDD